MLCIASQLMFDQLAKFVRKLFHAFVFAKELNPFVRFVFILDRI